MSPFRSHKRRHNFSDTPSETCECNSDIEDIRHFLFECPFYAIRRVTLAVNVIDILQRKSLSHLGNQPEFYLYGHPLLISLIIDKFYYQQICKRYHGIFNFSYVGLTPLPIPHTPSSPVTIVFDLFDLLLYSCFFLLYFCKFLGCHGFDLFSLPSHGTLFFPEKKIHKKRRLTFATIYIFCM